MNYPGIPMGMWLLFHRSFRERMVNILGCSEAAAAETEKKALPKYKEIIAGLPEFERSDRFKMNIVNCAMLAAFYLNLDEKPDVDPVRSATFCASRLLSMSTSISPMFRRSFSRLMSATRVVVFPLPGEDMKFRNSVP